MQALLVNNVVFSYNKNKKILNNCSFTINEGEIVGLLGLNGCGKSTLFSCITKELKYDGEILLYNDNIKTLKPKDIARRMSYIPQLDSIEVSISALDVVLMGYNSELSIFSSYKKEQIEEAINVLESFGLSDVVHNDYQTLSGGEKALTLLSRSLISKGNFMLLDEVAASLDLKNKYEVLSKLQEKVKNHNKTVLLSIHDPEAAINFCDRLLIMKDGIIFKEINTSNVSEEELTLTLSSIYGNIIVNKNEIDGKVYYSIMPR